MNKSKKAITGLMLMLALTMAVFISAISVSAASSVRRTNVKATIAGSSNSALKIQWNKCSGADGYVIYRRESVRVAYKRIATVGSSATTYTDSKLVAGKPYQYAVKAYSRQNSKYVYSKYTAATGATRPYATTVTPTVLSSSQVKLTWKPVARLDGYRIYRRASGGKWTLVADVNKKTTVYIDKKVSAGTKYIYTVRAYKRGGREKYAAAVRPSRSVITPKATNISQIWFTSSQKVVMKNILYAVETGGQVYGNQDYADFTRAYTNSSAEHAITIGAGQWYATEAQRLLQLIHTTMGDAQWKRYDRDNKLWKDVQKANWSTYKSITYKNRIVNIIKSDIGKKCQDVLMYRQIAEMEKEIRALGVTDVQAVGMLINIEHQGGYGAVTRVLRKTRKPYNLKNIYNALASDTGNQVGTYKTRQAKVYRWLNTYMK